MKTAILTFASLLCLTSTACAESPNQIETPKNYTLDLGHAYIGWETDHLGLSKTRGVFKSFDGTFLINESKPEQSKINFTIQTSSIDSNHVGRDNHLRNADFLDVENHPQMTFTSTKITMNSESKGVLIGDLTLRGITAPLSLNFTMVGDRQFPDFLPNYDELRAIGFEAEGILDRTKHGIDTVSFPGSPVPDEILLDIHFDLIDCNAAADTNVPCNWGRLKGFKGPNE